MKAKQTPPTAIRFTPDVHSWLKARAAANYRSLTAETNFLLEQMKKAEQEQPGNRD